MRRDIGTSKGEGLCLLDGEELRDFCGHTAPWDDGVFPTTTLDGTELPEASPSGNEIAAKRRLPHQLDDWKQRFPRAVACEGPGDEDVDGKDAMALRGLRLGQARRAHGAN